MPAPASTPTSLRRKTNQRMIAAKSRAPALPASRWAHPPAFRPLCRCRLNLYPSNL
jgi:hypothetical protein